MVDNIPEDEDFEYDGRFDAIVDEVLEQQRAGLKPQLTDFEQRYPDHAQQLREIFSTLLMAERMDNELSHASRKAAELRARSTEEFPKQIGDFELLYELGRGGMGVVFAARQFSLNRLVAVKVLSRHLAADARFAERFAREARSAAQLQHPNIVSVFSNGSDQGISYYSMQLIEGKNLAEVLDGVRRILLKGQSGPEQEGDEYLRRLLSNAGSKSPSPTIRVTSAANAPTKFLKAPSTVDQPGGDVVSQSPSKDLAPGAKDSSKTKSSARSSDQSNRAKRVAYYKNIAAMARDVAWALEYAHHQGTVHRDIKPSNLILDKNGKVWITDFGLAKLESEQRMTQAGDMLGTLRYVAPEQLDGISAPSCDIYGVGVTLYELAALIPAWTGENHAQLMNRVRTESVVRPRSIEPSIPADLETVILTAMARNPADRYRSARDLGDDLERFCKDEPIRARKPSSLESLIRWSMRNRLTAASILAILFLTAVVVPVITIAYSLKLSQEVSRSQTAERQTGIANANSKRQLVESLIQQARAVRVNRSISAKEDCIKTLQQANRVLNELVTSANYSLTIRMELRDEAIAALALPEFRESYHLPLEKPARKSSDFLHAKGDLIVLRERDQEREYTTVRDRNDMEKAILKLSGRAENARINQTKTHLLTHSGSREQTCEVAIWRIADREKIWRERLPDNQGAYSPNEDYVIAMQNTGRPIRIHVDSGKVEQGAQLCDPNRGFPATYCSPSTETIVLIYPDHMEVHNFDDGKLIKRIPNPQGRGQFDGAIWSPQDNWFATKSSNGMISVYDPKDWTLVRTLLCDVTGGSKYSATTDGRYLESSTWNRRFEIFDMLSGEEVLRFVPTGENDFLDFSEYLVGPLCDSKRARMMEFRPSTVYRTRVMTADATLIPNDISVREDGRLAVARIPRGKLALMDLQNDSTITIPISLSNMAFDAAGNLWGVSNEEISRWPVMPDEEIIRYGNPVSIGRIGSSSFAIDPTGATIAWNRNNGVAIAQTNAMSEPQIRKESGDVRIIDRAIARCWVVCDNQ
jgi:serine/threonine protein kinase/WD40 repeat protein